MKREQAVALLRELVSEELIEPTHMSIGLRTPNHYQLQVTNECKSARLIEFAKKNNLLIDEDKEKKYVRIYKP